MLNVTIHHVGTGHCSLTGKDGDGLTVTFEDGTVKNQFLTYRAFRQLLAMKLAPAKGDPSMATSLAPDRQQSAAT